MPSLFGDYSRDSESILMPRSRRTLRRWCPSITVPSGLAFREDGCPGLRDFTISSEDNLRNMSNFTRVSELSACKGFKGGYVMSANVSHHQARTFGTRKWPAAPS